MPAARESISRTTSPRGAAMRRPSAAMTKVCRSKKTAAGIDEVPRRPPGRPPKTQEAAAAKANSKMKVFTVGGMRGCRVVLGFDTQVLEQMIMTARAEKPFPTDMFGHLARYHSWLDKLPWQCKFSGSIVRPHIVRKYMMCVGCQPRRWHPAQVRSFENRPAAATQFRRDRVFEQSAVANASEEIELTVVHGCAGYCDVGIIVAAGPGGARIL